MVLGAPWKDAVKERGSSRAKRSIESRVEVGE